MTGCSQFAGACLDVGVGYDRLMLEGVFDQYNISVSPDRSGFDINEWGSSSCSYLMARDIEIIQGLSSNFALSADDAREKLVSFVNGLQVVQNAFQSRKMKIRNNHGQSH